MRKKVTKKTTPQRKKIAAKDLLRLKLATGVAMSPDEKQVAYTIERIDEKKNKYFTNIFMLDIDTGESTQFTHGDHVDSQPIWSHDGSQMVFVSTRDKKTGIYTMPSQGGAERQLLEVEGSVESLQWTPDDKHLVFNLQYADSHFIKDEKKKKEPPVYRHITRLWFRLDGAGYISNQIKHVCTLDVATAKLRQITKGKRDNEFASVSPDGKWIAYASNRARNQDTDWMRMELFVIPFKGGKERRVPTPAGPVWMPMFSPDSKKIAYMGHDDPDAGWGMKNVHIWTVGLNGRPAARDLMSKFDRQAIDESINDTSDFHGMGGLFWSGEGKRLFFISSDTGVTNLYSLPARGGKPTRLFKGKCHISGFSVNGKTRTAAVVYSDLTTPSEVITCPTTWNGEKRE